MLTDGLPTPDITKPLPACDLCCARTPEHQLLIGDQPQKRGRAASAPHGTGERRSQGQGQLASITSTPAQAVAGCTGKCTNRAGRSLAHHQAAGGGHLLGMPARTGAGVTQTSSPARPQTSRSYEAHRCPLGCRGGRTHEARDGLTQHQAAGGGHLHARQHARALAHEEEVAGQAAHQGQRAADADAGQHAQQQQLPVARHEEGRQARALACSR